MRSKMLLLAGAALCVAGPSMAETPPEKAPTRTLTVTTTITSEGLAGNGVETATPSDPLRAGCDAKAQKNFLQGWQSGGEYQRSHALDSIRQLRRGGSVAQIEYASDCLKRYYGLRAGRQQTALDAEAGMVFFGALGSLASVKAGATTQTYWNVAALVPVVVAEFNAHEPTRDLYAGGRVGLDIIGGRYNRLEILTSVLQTSMGNENNWVKLPHEDGCEPLVNGTNSVEEWPAGEDRTAMLSDYRKFKQACLNANYLNEDLRDLYKAATNWKANYASAYARDLLRLDDEILNKDRDLRYSPVETLSAMAAAPFNVAATLLSGESGSQAIDRLKTQRVFSALNVPLEPVNLPPLPSSIPDFLAISDATLSRPAARAAEDAAAKPSAKPAAAAPKKTAKAVSDMLATLQAAATGLNDARGDLNYRLLIASRIATLASYDRLDFTYDATTARISVVLTTTPPPPVASPLAGR